jgi:hypothetical protein
MSTVRDAADATDRPTADERTKRDAALVVQLVRMYAFLEPSIAAATVVVSARHHGIDIDRPHARRLIELCKQQRRRP